MQGKLPLIIAIVFGLIAFVGIGRYLQQQNQPEEVVRVIVANKSLEVGHTLSRTDLGYLVVPASLMRGVRGYYRPGDEALLSGQTVIQSLGQNGMILEAHIRREFDTQGARTKFSSLLNQGERAVSIPLDSEGMVSQFVRPGDRVDILANMDIPDVIEERIEIPNAMPQIISREVSRPTTVYLFQNVQVLAVGSDFLQPNILEAASAQRGRAARSVTIAVTPEEAQLLSFAMRYGNSAGSAIGGDITFTLSLRRDDDRDIVEFPDLVTFADVTNLGELRRLQIQRDSRESREIDQATRGLSRTINQFIPSQVP